MGAESERTEARLSMLRGKRGEKAVKTAEVVDDDDRRPGRGAPAPSEAQGRQGFHDSGVDRGARRLGWGQTVKYEGPPARGEGQAS